MKIYQACKRLNNKFGIYLQMTKDHIYNVVLFADGGWMADQKEVCISSSCSAGRALDWGSKGCWFEPYRRQRRCLVSLSKTLYPLLKLRSEILWHRFFAVPAFIRRFRHYIAVRKLFLKASSNFSSRFRRSACFWQSPHILRKSENLEMRPHTKSS